jgi:phage-related protein
MGTAIYIDDYDLDGLGFICEDAQGHRGATGARFALGQIPASDRGDVHLIDGHDFQPRIITVMGVVRQSSLANLKDAIDELQGRLTAGGGDILARFVDGSDRFVTARLRRLELIPTAPQFTQLKQRVNFELFCANPLVSETSNTQATFTSTPDDCPLGSAISLPVIVLTGAAAYSNPTFTYKDHSGATITTMGFTIAVGSGETLTIDCENFTVVHSVSGNEIDKLTSGTFIRLRPEDADDPYGTPDWPTLEVSPSASCTATYKKRYVG